MDTRELLISIGFVITIIGWFTAYYLSKKKELSFEKLKWRKAHIDSQLSDLYGPIYGLLIENGKHRSDIETIFGRKIIFESTDKLEHEEEKIWIHYLENYFIPNNRKIIDIIKNNLHLIHNETMPQAWVEFIDYASSYEAAHKQYTDIDRYYGFRSKTNFPSNFEKEISSTFTRLKKLQSELTQSHSNS